MISRNNPYLLHYFTKEWIESESQYPSYYDIHSPIVKDIIDMICIEYNMTYEMMTSESNTQHVKTARDVLAWAIHYKRPTPTVIAYVTHRSYNNYFASHWKFVSKIEKDRLLKQTVERLKQKLDEL